MSLRARPDSRRGSPPPLARRPIRGARLWALACLASAVPVRAEPVAVGRHVDVALAPSGRADRPRGRVSAEAPRQRWIARLPFRRPQAPLVLADGSLVVAGAGGVAAYAADGTERWQRTTPSIAFAPALAVNGDVLLVTEAFELLRFTQAGDPREPVEATPRVAGDPLVLADGTIFVGARDGRLFALDARGALVREIPATHRGSVRLASLGDGRVVAAGDDEMLTVASAHLGLERALTLPGPIAAGPVVSDDGTVWLIGQHGHVWRVPFDAPPRSIGRVSGRGRRPPPVLGRDGDLRIGDDDVRCLAPSGRPRWRRAVDAFVGPIALDADDTAIFFTARGTLYAIARDGALRWQVPMSEGAAAPAVLAADGTIYVAMPSGRLSAWR